MALQRQTRVVATVVAALALGGAPTAAEAQVTQRGAPQPTTPRLVVVPFRGTDRPAAMAATDAVRDRLMRDHSARDLWIITRKDIDNQLTASGYPTEEALSMNDAVALARSMRADQFVDGSVTPIEGGQFRVDARVVLTRSGALVQPLPSQTVGRPQDAAQAVAREVREVRRHLDQETQCYNNASQQNYAEAQAAAARAIEQYQRSTVARICLANVLAAQNAAPDTIVALTNEILAIDPRSRPALQLKYNAQVALGQNDQATNTLTQLLAADPSNVDLQNRVVNQLAASGKYDTAATIIGQALQENPGDPELMRTGFLVFQAASRWPQAIQVGELLAQVDTALDRQYFLRMANAYVQTQQPQKASEVISRGTAKFPQDAELLAGAASIYREAGQLQQAVEMLRRGLAINAQTPQANLVLAQLFVDMNQPDSAFVALQAAQAAGDSAAQVAAVAGQIAQRALESGQQSQSRQDFLRAIRFAELADQVNAGNPYKFILGAAAFYATQQELQAAQQSKSCEMARAAKEHLAIVNRTIPMAGSVSPQAASQIMSTAQTWGPYPDQMIQAFCR